MQFKPTNPDSPHWVKADRTRIPLTDMTEDHLKNAIAYFLAVEKIDSLVEIQREDVANRLEQLMRELRRRVEEF